MKIHIAFPSFNNALVLEQLGKLGTVTIQQGNRPDESELEQLVQEYDVLIIGIMAKMTEKVYQKASKLKVIASLSIGLDHIHEKFKSDKKYTILNCTNSNVSSVAEYTVLSMLHMLKDFNSFQKLARENKDRYSIDRPRDIMGKTIGILGAGSIARNVANKLKPFNTNTLFWTRNPDNHQDFTDATYSDLDNLLRTSDIISLHLPLTPETSHFLSGSRLDMLKKGAIVINTSRGQLIDNNYLFDLILQEKIFGTVIDDFNSEILGNIPNSERIVITPHVAGVTKEAINNMDNEITEKLTKFFS